MKREIAAGIILAALFTASVINMNVLLRRSEEMSERIAASEKLYLEGRRDEAEQIVKNTLRAWTDWDDYTHIMLRHTETELVIESFYALLRAIESADGASATDFEHMQAVIKGLANAERLRLGSIF